MVREVNAGESCGAVVFVAAGCQSDINQHDELMVCMSVPRTTLVLLLVPHGVGAHVWLVGLGRALLVAKHLLEELELGGCGEDEEEEGGEEGCEMHFGRFDCWFRGGMTVQWLMVVVMEGHVVVPDACT